MIHWAHNMSYTFYNVPYGGHQKYAWVYNMMVIVLEPFIKKFFIYLYTSELPQHSTLIIGLEFCNIKMYQISTHIVFLLQSGIFQNDPID